MPFTENSPVAAIGNGRDRDMFGLQFHPEVNHTPLGKDILGNFLFRICECDGTWTPGNVAADAIARIREQVGDGRVICALSGGVDSAVTAALLHRAIGEQLTCIFVNNGLLRLEEAERVQATFHRGMGLNLAYVDASERFVTRLAGVIDPEAKRKVIGEEFIRVFEEAATGLGETEFLAQGTLYPDVIESEAPGNAPAGAQLFRPHQVPPQRGRPAGEHEAAAGGAAALPVQGRGARRGRGAWACLPTWSIASPSPALGSPSASSVR